MIFSAIVAVGTNLLIGSQGGLPWRLPADLKRFRKLTWGKPIIMGRKTFESIGKPLEGRQNIVLSRTKPTHSEVDYVTSVSQALALVEAAPEVVVIGGKEVYQLFLEKLNRLYLTIVKGEFTGDTFFPNLIPGTWTLQESIPFPKDEKNPYDTIFQIWEKQTESGSWNLQQSLGMGWIGAQWGFSVKE